MDLLYSQNEKAFLERSYPNTNGMQMLLLPDISFIPPAFFWSFLFLAYLERKTVVPPPPPTPSRRKHGVRDPQGLSGNANTLV